MTTNNPDAGAEKRWRDLATRALKRAAIEKALDAAGVVAADRDLVLDRMIGFVSIVERDGELVPAVVNEAGVERLGSRSLPVSVETLALEFREKYPRNFAKPETTAGSTRAPAGSPWKGGNPYAAPAEQRNLSEIGRLYRIDRALHDRWKAEAEGKPAPAALRGPAPLTGDLSRFFRRGPDWNLSAQGRLYVENRAQYDAIKAAIGE